jgi:hypothetical protein
MLQHQGAVHRRKAAQTDKQTEKQAACVARKGAWHVFTSASHSLPCAWLLVLLITSLTCVPMTGLCWVTGEVLPLAWVTIAARWRRGHGGSSWPKPSLLELVQAIWSSYDWSKASWSRNGFSSSHSCCGFCSLSGISFGNSWSSQTQGRVGQLPIKWWTAGLWQLQSFKLRKHQRCLQKRNCHGINLLNSP